MNRNDLIIYEFNQIDLYELTSIQHKELAHNIVNNVNIKQLEEKIHEVILKLSGVCGPCFGADISYIASDNQKRLELIHELLYNFNNFKARVKYMKRHIKDYDTDDEQVFSFNSTVKELMKTIFDYSEFRSEELEEIKQQILLNTSDKELFNEALDGLKYTLMDLKQILKE